MKKIRKTEKIQKKSIFSLETKLKFYKITRNLEKGTDFANSLLFLGIRHPVFGTIGVVSNILKLILKYNSLSFEDVTQSWYCSDNSNKVFNFLAKKLTKYSVYKYEDRDLELFKVNNIYILKSEGYFWYEDIGHEKKIFSELLSLDKNLKLIPNEKSFDIIPLKNIEIYTSSRAIEIYKRLNAFISKGNTRSALINGPAGMGKSCIALFVADSFIKQYGGTILHVDLKDFEDFTSSDLQIFLEFANSDVLILDDIDKYRDPDALLYLLETNRQRHKLVLATSNELGMLTESVRRPKRFDDIFYVQSLPPEMLEVYKELNEMLDEKQREEILKWPIAYVDDLDIRRKNLEDFDLEEEMSELRTRLGIEDVREEKPRRKNRKKLYDLL